MSKYAIEVKEISTRVVIIEADNYLEAEDIIVDAYNKNRLVLHPDNSLVEMTLKNYTDELKENIGEESFNKLIQSRECQSRLLEDSQYIKMMNEPEKYIL